MRRSVWIAGLKGSFVSFLGMSEFEAEKAAVIAADHAREPWDPERVVVPECWAFNDGEKWTLAKSLGQWSAAEIDRCAEILNDFEGAREAVGYACVAFAEVGGSSSSEADILRRLRTFFQIEEEE